MQNSPTSYYTRNPQRDDEMSIAELDALVHELQLAQAIEFLKDWAPEGPWDLVSIQDDAPRGRRFMPGDESELFNWLATENADRSVYFHLNRCLSAPAKGKATKADIDKVVALHVDVDPPKDCKDPDGLRAARLRILERLKNPPAGVPLPTCVVDSGGGFQAFWWLRTPITINGDAAEVECYTRWLEQKFQADNCHNVDRIMRLPGTINRPNETKRARGRVDSPTGVMWWEPERVFDLNAFGKADPEETSTSISSSADFPLDHTPIEDLDRLRRAGVSETALKLIEHGHAPGADRSRDVLAVAGALIRCGIAPEVVYAILTDEHWPISESVLEKGDREAIRAIYKAIADHADARKKQEEASRTFAERLRMSKASPATEPAPRVGFLRSVGPWILEESDVPPVFEDLIYERELVMAYGAPGSGKTLVVLDAALSLALGLPSWAGYELPEGGRQVVYVSAEGNRGMRKRIRAWAVKHGKSVEDVIRRLDGRFFLFEKAVGLLSDDEWRDFHQEVDAPKGLTPRLFVFDTLSRCIAGADENAAKEMSVAVERLGELARETGAAVVVVHHSAKSGASERGSSVWAGAVDVKFRVAQDAQHPGKILVEFEKMKDGEMPTGGLAFRVEQVELGKSAKGKRQTSAIARFEPRRADGVSPSMLSMVRALGRAGVGAALTEIEWKTRMGQAPRRGGRFLTDVRLLADRGILTEPDTTQKAHRYSLAPEGWRLFHDDAGR